MRIISAILLAMRIIPTVLFIFAFALVLGAFVLGCSAPQKPYAYKTDDGKFRPVNDPSKYSKEDALKAAKEFGYYTGQAVTDPIPDFDKAE